MKWQPQSSLTDQEVKNGMNVMIVDGLASETMTTLTAGTFLIAFAVLTGATNFQIGLLAGLPTATNFFQLLSIWLCRRVRNRKIICVVLSVSARIPLIAVGMVAVLTPYLPFSVMIGFLLFHYLFASVSGPVWNAWVKDIVPSSKLGAYFSKRSSYMQLLNVVLGLLTALLLDYTKAEYPFFEQKMYGYIFITAGLAGISGAIYMGRAPEPQLQASSENIFKLLKKPFADRNFRKLLLFNSFWLFAINIATPFFTVFMMKAVGLSLSIIIVLNIVSQLCSILTIRVWGRYADRYSNKNIIALGGPLYIGCLIAWCFVGLNSHVVVNFALLFLIHACMGIANAGVNLSLTNISLKLSPAAESVIYLSTRNIFTSVFSALAPIVGGILVDYFSTRSLDLRIQWTGPDLEKSIYLIALHQWNFLFVIGAFIALVALEILIGVKESGEVNKGHIVRIMRSNLKTNLKDYFIIGQIIDLQETLLEKFKRR